MKGVQVQAQMEGNLVSGCNSARSVLQQFHAYHLRRASFARRCEKHPSVEDWKSSVTVSDEKQYDEAVNVIGDLQGLYLTLYDRLMKNWEKINLPKGRNRSCSNIYF